LNETYSTKPNSLKWGKMHQLTLKHPLGKVKILDNIFDFNRGPLPVGGSFHTVNPTAYSVHQAFGAIHGASQRHIFNTGDWADSYVVIPTGTSGIPASEYYCNQMEMFVDGKYRKDMWNQNDIESKSVYKTTFSPK
ncbi:MAG: penicillin acylase family protein, partial [Ignavibacteria bacterium]|nr:penicillin acylase family protein [Ignavibacteria bacterium]